MLKVASPDHKTEIMRQTWPPRPKNGFGNSLPDFNRKVFSFMEGMIAYCTKGIKFF